MSDLFFNAPLRWPRRCTAGNRDGPRDSPCRGIGVRNQSLELSMGMDRAAATLQGPGVQRLRHTGSGICGAVIERPRNLATSARDRALVCPLPSSQIKLLEAPPLPARRGVVTEGWCFRKRFRPDMASGYGKETVLSLVVLFSGTMASDRESQLADVLRLKVPRTWERRFDQPRKQLLETGRLDS
jgi:hypothetical protein